jgi:anaerobic ribonucleoside-triphosphate reductase activating protein
MLIHNRMENSSVNGPGDRAVIWLQGCTLNCEGCWNPDTHAFSGKDVMPQELAEWVLSLPDIEGVTFSGGEPMQQAPELYVLMALIKGGAPNMTFGMYTGYTHHELETGRWRWRSRHDVGFKAGSSELWAQVKSMMDFAIMGRYNKLVAGSDKPLCGSRNQELVFFSNRYSEEDIRPQEIEMVVDESGLVQITGFPVGLDVDALVR